MDVQTVEEAVDELARMLRADGADLLLESADPRTARIRLRLEVENASCQECILPPDQLVTVVNDALSRRVPEEFELLLDDPRRATGRHH